MPSKHHCRKIQQARTASLCKPRGFSIPFLPSFHRLHLSSGPRQSKECLNDNNSKENQHQSRWLRSTKSSKDRPLFLLLTWMSSLQQDEIHDFKHHLLLTGDLITAHFSKLEGRMALPFSAFHETLCWVYKRLNIGEKIKNAYMVKKR